MEQFRYVRCLYCRTGCESRVCQVIERLGYGKALSPQKVKRLFRKGKWEEITDTLFRGYVFVYSNLAVSHQLIFQISDVLRILQYETGTEGYLVGKDREMAEMFLRQDGVLGILQAIREGSFIRITDGLLADYQGKVLKMDKRKQMAQIQLSVAGDINQVWLSYEILEPQETEDKTSETSS